MESTYRPRRSEIGCRAPLTVTVNEALALIGIGRTKLYELIAEGRLETTSIGRRRLVKFASVERLLEGPVPSKAEADAAWHRKARQLGLGLDEKQVGQQATSRSKGWPAGKGS